MEVAAVGIDSTDTFEPTNDDEDERPGVPKLVAGCDVSMNRSRRLARGVLEVASGVPALRGVSEPSDPKDE